MIITLFYSAFTLKVVKVLILSFLFQQQRFTISLIKPNNWLEIRVFLLFYFSFKHSLCSFKEIITLW